MVSAAPAGLEDALAYPFFQSVFDRKSRRMGLGHGRCPGTLELREPLRAGAPTELEEALLLVAGTGLTGLNLGDIDPSMGADAMVQWTARTWPSSCSNHGTELFFTNDDGTYFLDMWNLMPEHGEIATLSGQAARGPGRVDPGARARRQEAARRPGARQLPTGLPGLFVFNHWNANKPGTTLFMPVSNMTLEYINLLFIYFSPEYRFTLVDETNGYALAGLQRLDRLGPPGPRPPDGHRRDRAAGAVDAGRRAGLHLPEHQPGPAGDGPGRLDLHRLHRPLRAGRHGRAGPGLPLRGGQARARACRWAATGSSRPSCPPYHADMCGGGRRTSSSVKWAQYEPDKPKAYLEPDKVIGADRRARRRHDPDRQGLLPVRPRDLRALPGVPGPDVPAPDRARPSTWTRTSTRSYYPPGALTDQHHSHFERWHPELAGDDGRPPRRDGAPGRAPPRAPAVRRCRPGRSRR